MAVTAAAWAVRVPPVLLLPLEGAEAGTPSHCTRSMEVHLIRHAQGTHNLAEEDAHASGRHGASPEHARLFEAHGKAWVLLEQVSGRAHWDAPLTDEGWRQAVRLRREIETSGQSFDLVVASPMRRTLQTALAALPQLSSGGVRTIFPGPSDNLGCDESGDAVGTDASAAAAATEAAAAVADATIVESGATSMQHTAASPYRAPFALDGPATVPIIVSDLLRERVAHYTCDRRLPVSELRRVAFGGAAVATEPPHIDFEQGQVPLPCSLVPWACAVSRCVGDAALIRPDSQVLARWEGGGWRRHWWGGGDQTQRVVVGQADRSSDVRMPGRGLRDRGARPLCLFPLPGWISKTPTSLSPPPSG
jgi:hypothetical protein